MNIALHAKKIAKTRLQELRRKNDSQKKRFIVLTSSLSIVLIFILWIVYLNISLPSFEEEVAASESELEQTSPKVSVNGFFETFQNGLAAISESVKTTINTFKQSLTTSNQFSFEGEGATYIPPSLDPIPSTELK